MNPVIIKRKSIRSYVREPLSVDEYEAVRKIVSSAEPLIPDVKTEFVIMAEDEFHKATSGLFKVVAPYYIVLRSEKKDGRLLNAGCIGEEFVLKLTEMNLGTCWLGGAKERGKNKNSLEYVISIAFGKTIEDFRADASKAPRLKLSDIINGDTDAHIDALEAARLAPSGMNFQPARYLCAGGAVHIYRKRSKNFLGLFAKMQEIDCGIAMGNIRFENPAYKYRKEETPPKLAGCEYVGSLYK